MYIKYSHFLHKIIDFVSLILINMLKINNE